MQRRPWYKHHKSSLGSHNTCSAPPKQCQQDHSLRKHPVVHDVPLIALMPIMSISRARLFLFQFFQFSLLLLFLPNDCRQ